MQNQDNNNFSSKPPLLTEKPMTERNIGQKYKSHKDAWNSGKAEYQPINYLQTGPTQNNNNNLRPFTGIRHITPVGDPVGQQNRTQNNYFKPNNPGQFNFPPRFKAPSMFNSHFSSGPKLKIPESDKDNKNEAAPSKNKWHIEIDEEYGYNSEISDVKQQEAVKSEEEDDYGFNQVISKDTVTDKKPSLLGDNPADKLPPPKFEITEEINEEEKAKEEPPKPKWIS